MVVWISFNKSQSVIGWHQISQNYIDQGSQPVEKPEKNDHQREVYLEFIQLSDDSLTDMNGRRWLNLGLRLLQSGHCRVFNAVTARLPSVTLPSLAFPVVPLRHLLLEACRKQSHQLVNLFAVVVHFVGHGVWVQVGECSVHPSAVQLDKLSLPATATQHQTIISLWRPLLPYGYSYKASCERPG